MYNVQSKSVNAHVQIDNSLIIIFHRENFKTGNSKETEAKTDISDFYVLPAILQRHSSIIMEYIIEQQ